MNIFDELENIYNEIDDNYAKIELDARSKGQSKKETKYSYKRKLNDQAYFLFMFTRLEDRIKYLSDNLINHKYSSISNWKNKRAWDIIHKQKTDDNLHLMNRVALLTPKGNSDYNLIDRYYKQRNEVGHGGSFTIPINIPTVIIDMKRLYKDLKG